MDGSKIQSGANDSTTAANEDAVAGTFAPQRAKTTAAAPGKSRVAAAAVPTS